MTAAERSWLDRPWVVVAALAGVLGFTLSLLAREYETFPLDRATESALTELGPWFFPVGTFFNESFFVLVAMAWVGTVLWALRSRRLDIAASFAAAAFLRPLLQLLKELSDRPRPTGDFLIRDPSASDAFPSGHVLTVAIPALLWIVLATELLPRRLVRPVRVVGAAAIALTALSRIWGGAHWLSDVYGGTVWSLFAVGLVLAIRPLWSRLLGARATAAERAT